MNWFIHYAVVAFIAAAAISVVLDRFRTGSTATVLLTALVWPVAVIGAVQIVLWIALADSFRASTAGVTAAGRLALDAPPL